MGIRDEKTGTNQILGDARFTAAALTSDTDAKHLAKPVLALCKTCEDGEEIWMKAKSAAAHASADEFVARTNVVRMLQKTEGALTTLYPGRRKRVRSYFRPTRKKAKVATTTTGGDAK